MMDDRKPNGPPKPILRVFQEQLFIDVHTGPARLEFEKRRLLAGISGDKKVASTTGRMKLETRRRVFAMAAAVLIAVVGAMIWRGIDAAKPPQPMALAGLWRLTEGDALSTGRPIRVPHDHGAKIVWPNRTAIWLAANAEVSLAPPAAAFIQFKKGRLLAKVTPTKKGQTFRVATPLGAVMVHGTAFSISGGDDHITVRLHQGAVTFAHAGSTVAIAPGFELDVQRGRAPVVREMDDTSVLTDLMIAEKTERLNGPPLPGLGRRIEISPINIATDKADRSRVPVGRPTLLAQKRVKQKKPAPRNAVAPVPVLPGKEDELFIDPALQDIEVLAVEKVDDADPSSVIESMMREGRYGACIQTADGYLRAHPQGVFVERVQFLKGCCQTRSGNLSAGREAFERYLIQFPEGRYWKRVSNILGE